MLQPDTPDRYQLAWSDSASKRRCAKQASSQRDNVKTRLSNFKYMILFNYLTGRYNVALRNASLSPSFRMDAAKF